jgi:pimeloyl-ACP methyl ester carboxylesterase/DNA-binding CsgD family transcriptional regulator
MNSPALRYVKTSDGVRIAYISVGEGPALVFASNIFGEALGYELLVGSHWRVVTDRLAALGWRVVRYDVRGMGYSDRDVDDLSLDARVRDLAAVVEHLAVETFALGGLDIGAATAIAYAARNPESVSHLVLQTPWASGARYYEIPDLKISLSASALATTEREWKLFANIQGSIARGFEDQESVRLGTEAFLRTTSPAGFAAFNRATISIDVRSLLPQVIAPTLVVYEPAFKFGSLELCQEVAAGIPNAQFVTVHDNSIGGFVHDGHVAAIDQFLRAGIVTARAPQTPSPSMVPSNGLTPREVEVLRRVAAGSTNKEIAADLNIAVPTVERHLVNLYTKIGARGRADAIAYALRHHLDTPQA